MAELCVRCGKDEQWFQWPPLCFGCGIDAAMEQAETDVHWSLWSEDQIGGLNG